MFDRHWPAIHRWCVSRAGPAGEDLAAETFRIAFDERARSIRATTTPGRGSTASPRTCCGTTSGARAARRAAGPRPVDDFTDDALGRVEARALGPRLAAALRAVASIDRDALLLHAWAELTYAEIARATGIPVGTVRSRIHRARTPPARPAGQGTHDERA